MKKVLLASFALFSISALQAHPALDSTTTEFNRATFNFKNFLKEYKQAEANIDQFSPQEKTEFQSLSRKAINMIDRSMKTGKPITRSESDISDAANFHIGEVLRATNEGDTNRAEYHANEFYDLHTQLPPVRLPDENESIKWLERSHEYRMRDKARRAQSENEGFDFVDHAG